MVAGEMEGEPMTDATGFMFAALVGVPLVMAVVTLLSGDRRTRYANLVVAVLVGLFAVYAVGSHLLAGDFDGHVVMAGLAGVLVFLAAGLSAAWLRRPASAEVTSGAEPRRPRSRAGI